MLYEPFNDYGMYVYIFWTERPRSNPSFEKLQPFIFHDFLTFICLPRTNYVRMYMYMYVCRYI
jgi:hypothetical protein